jgi:alanine racemase
MTSTRPTWAEISRSRLIHNHGVLRRLAGAETELLCVVKANAYGHGLVECARTLAGNGARWFGVTCVEEGVVLRRELPEAGILVMSGIWLGEAEAALEHDLTPVVWEARHIGLLEGAAKRLRAAPGDCPVHLEIDTGMSRQGVRPEDRRVAAGAVWGGFAAAVAGGDDAFSQPGKCGADGGADAGICNRRGHDSRTRFMA